MKNAVMFGWWEGERERGNGSKKRKKKRERGLADGGRWALWHRSSGGADIVIREWLQGQSVQQIMGVGTDKPALFGSPVRFPFEAERTRTVLGMGWKGISIGAK